MTRLLTDLCVVYFLSDGYVHIIMDEMQCHLLFIYLSEGRNFSEMSLKIYMIWGVIAPYTLLRLTKEPKRKDKMGLKQ